MFSPRYLLYFQVTYVDFFMYESLDRVQSILPTFAAKYPNIQAYQKRIRDLKGIKEYMASPRFQKIKTRFNGRQAAFGAGDY